MDWATWALVVITLIGAIITVSIKLGSLSTRVDVLEAARRSIDDKLDAILRSVSETKNSISRIEGSMEAHLHERN
jgi:low affinity Fe/Cu permease